MKRISIIAAVALGVTLVWACSSAVEDLVRTPDASAGDNISTSGSRLQIRPIVYEGDDGSVIRMGEEIFDTELGVVCEPMLAADGVVRCLPKGIVRSRSWATFVDENCSDLGTALWQEECESEYILMHAEDIFSCLPAERYEVYRIGDKSVPIYSGVPGVFCNSADSVGRELILVPPDAMVRLQK